MPLWENYKIKVETRVTITAGSKDELIAQYSAFGESDATSNEDVGRPDIREGVSKATNAAAADSYRIAMAVRTNRRKQIGYTDGD